MHVGFSEKLTHSIESICEAQISRFNTLSRGAITSTAILKTTHGSHYFLKYGCDVKTEILLNAERYGLELIDSSNSSIQVPDVIGFDTIDNTSFLLLEYIPSKNPEPHDMHHLAKGLVQLHEITAEYCGLKQDNFIGTLEQNNTKIISWPEFYFENRLKPQIELAKLNGLLSEKETPPSEDLLHALHDKLPQIKPCLLHGDLWNGNYLIHKDGRPFLIDPSAYFGDPLVDIAMSKLFGGFSKEFYNSYFQHHTIEHSESIIGIYQLYYMLVHLNLFGNSYKNGCIRGLAELMK